MQLQTHREQGRGGTRGDPPALSARKVIYTDYDNTMLVQNAGVAIVRFYLWHGPGHFLSRAKRVLRLRHILDPHLRDRYNAVLRLLTSQQRQEVLAGLPPSAAWIAAVHESARVHDTFDRAADHQVTRAQDRPTKSVTEHPTEIVVVSRNCLTAIREWLALHDSALRKQGIIVREVVANGPLDDPSWVVRWYAGASTNRLAKGPLTVDQKRAYLPEDCTYIGDKWERPLAPYVGRFVRV